ncbi:hypothetical protein RIF29_05421 [Crotalaria pallida]|uniref:Auxin response factor domain-containing protein n=1 Tax=Crotalaria pallida TaxID=3830 RepID=A0AAN9J204_CROPI
MVPKIKAPDVVPIDPPLTTGFKCPRTNKQFNTTVFYFFIRPQLRSSSPFALHPQLPSSGCVPQALFSSPCQLRSPLVLITPVDHPENAEDEYRIDGMEDIGRVRFDLLNGDEVYKYHFADNGTGYEVSSSEFIIPLHKFSKSFDCSYSVGMRFRMRFETEDAAERRFTGLIAGISDVDPVRWPGSKWRCLLGVLQY